MWDEIQDMSGEIFDMTRLDVICPSCPWEGSTVDASEAPYLAISSQRITGTPRSVRMGGSSLNIPMGMPPKALAQGRALLPS